MYGAGQAIFFNGLAYSFIGLIAIFWLIKRLHKGGIDKEDAYQALTWIVIATIIYVIMGNEGAYYEFLNLLDMPVNYVSAITAQSFGSTDFATTFGSNFAHCDSLFNNESTKRLFLFLVEALSLLFYVYTHCNDNREFSNGGIRKYRVNSRNK